MSVYTHRIYLTHIDAHTIVVSSKYVSTPAIEFQTMFLIVKVFMWTNKFLASVEALGIWKMKTEEDAEPYQGI